MATGKITKRTVDQLSATGRDVFLWDDELRGFGIKATHRGLKSYVYQYRMGGREAATRRYSIGAHGSPWTPALARKEAERLAILVGQGKDPSAADDERRRQAVELAFDNYAQRFAESCTGAGWRGMVERTLRLYAIPHFKRKPISTITRSDVASFLDRIPAEQVALRRNAFAVIRRLFRNAVSRGDIERSPCEGMETPRAVTARDRVLADSELQHIWHASADAGVPFGPIIRLLIVTGQRREEVGGLNWVELDQAERLWTLPKERSKNDVAHTIPLNDLAIDILNHQAGTTTWPRSGFVFPTSRGTRFTAYARGKRVIDAALARTKDGIAAPWRLHDLRRTLATGFQKLGVRFEVTEAVLNHLSGHKTGVAAVYQTHDWRDEKRDALEKWSRHIRELIEPRDPDEASHCCDRMLALVEAKAIAIDDIAGKLVIASAIGCENVLPLSFCPWCGTKL